MFTSLMCLPVAFAYVSLKSRDYTHPVASSPRVLALRHISDSQNANLSLPVEGEAANDYIDRIFPSIDSTFGQGIPVNSTSNLGERDVLGKRDEGTDLIGNSTRECGFSTTTWTVQYENITDPFFYNFTLDFGNAPTSFHLDTAVGTYIYSDGHEADDVPLLDIIHDVRSLARQEWTEFQPTVNHTFHNGQAVLDDIDKIFATGIACKNETIPDDQQTAWIHDELRRKLLMDFSPEEAEEGVCNLVGGTCPTPSPSQSDGPVATVGASQDAGPPGPSRQGNVLYTLIWATVGGALGALIAVQNDLAFSPHTVQPKGVTNVAELGIVLGVVGSILARQNSLGVYNAPAERTVRTLHQVGTVVRDRAQEIPSATRRTAMQGRETINQNVVIAWLRGRLRRFLQELLADENGCDEEGICLVETGSMQTIPVQPMVTNDPGMNNRRKRGMRKRQTAGQCVSIDEAFTLARQLGSLYSTPAGLLDLHSVEEVHAVYAPQERDPGGNCPASG
ncbi:MAG: hypothetical protein Q9169_006438 [Polycauliona sp. 2 TL-2023]